MKKLIRILIGNTLENNTQSTIVWCFQSVKMQNILIVIIKNYAFFYTADWSQEINKSLLETKSKPEAILCYNFKTYFPNSWSECNFISTVFLKDIFYPISREFSWAAYCCIQASIPIQFHLCKRRRRRGFLLSLILIHSFPTGL